MSLPVRSRVFIGRSKQTVFGHENLNRQARGLLGTVLSYSPATDKYHVFWDNGTYSNTRAEWLLPTGGVDTREWLQTTPPTKGNEMAVTLSTATINVELKLNSQTTTDQVVEFRDRLVNAGFTKKQAGRIATNAFVLAQVKEPEPTFDF